MTIKNEFSKDAIITGLRAGKELISYRSKDINAILNDNEKLIDSLVQNGELIAIQVYDSPKTIAYIYKMAR